MDESTKDHLISRRNALRAGGIGVGTALWASPVVQLISMSEADAASEAPPTVHPGNPPHGNPRDGNPDDHPGNGNPGNGNPGRGRGRG